MTYIDRTECPECGAELRRFGEDELRVTCCETTISWVERAETEIEADIDPEERRDPGEQSGLDGWS